MPLVDHRHVTYDKVSKLWQAWSSAYSTSERCQVEQSTGGHVGAGATSSGSADQCLKPKHGLLGLFEDDLAAAVAVDLDFVSRLKSGMSEGLGGNQLAPNVGTSAVAPNSADALLAQFPECKENQLFDM